MSSITNTNESVSVDRLLSIREVARILDYSPGVVRRLVHDGKLDVVRLTGPRSRWRFRTRDVQALIDDGIKEES